MSKKLSAKGAVPKDKDAQASCESKKIPAKSEANKLHGLAPNGADAQASFKQSEAEFDALLQQLSAVIGIDDVVFCTGLLQHFLWLFQDNDGKFNSARFRYAIAFLQGDKPRNRNGAIKKMHFFGIAHVDCGIWQTALVRANSAGDR